MEHVLWIGGPPAAGKSTVATRLARRYGLRLYRADTRTWAHRDRALAAGNRAARRWEALTPAGRWEHATPEEMLEMSLHRERGAMLIDDVRALPVSPLIIAEGTPVPATAVASGIALRSQAVWLLPTPEVQQARLAAAGTAGGPMILYRRLADVIERDARDHGVPTLTVDGSAGVADTVSAVERLFGHRLRAGPGAKTRSERQSLLREMNEAVVEQIRGYYARPWAAGNPESVEQSFVCECGETTCADDVQLTVGAVATAPALAPGHAGYRA